METSVEISRVSLFLKSSATCSRPDGPDLRPKPPSHRTWEPDQGSRIEVILAVAAIVFGQAELMPERRVAERAVQEVRAMRGAALLLGMLLYGVSGNLAQADPYRWCAEYGGGRGGGGTNCYFMTFGQCQAAISGVGGFCRPNPFYTGNDRRRGYRSYGMSPDRR